MVNRVSFRAEPSVLLEFRLSVEFNATQELDTADFSKLSTKVHIRDVSVPTDMAEFPCERGRLRSNQEYNLQKTKKLGRRTCHICLLKEMG